MKLKLYLFFLLSFLIFVLSFSLFTIYETDKGMIIQLGKLQIDTKKQVTKICSPGLHFKLPFIQEYLSFDLRKKLLDVKSSRITSLEKKDLIVDFYILWNISDLYLYYTRTGGNRINAEQLLQQKVVAALKAEFGRCTVSEVVHGERLELMIRLKDSTDENTKDMGISILDVRIKRIDLPDEVRESVYSRMKAERERVASEIRANGAAEARKTRAISEREERVIIAEALKKVYEIKGLGEAKALEIYANSFSKNIDFYEFYRTLNAYKHIFSSKNDILLLKPNSDFFKYFNKLVD